MRGQELREDLAHLPALLRDPLASDELPAHDLPLQGAVLHDALRAGVGARPDDDGPRRMLEERPHEAVLGCEESDAIEDGFEARQRHDLVDESRGVVAPDDGDAVTDRARAVRGRIRGEVAALGVSAHVQGPAKVGRDVLEIVEGSDLRGNDAIAHLAILAPADHRVIRPAVRDVGDPPGEKRGQGAELLVSARVETAHVLAEQGAPKAVARRHLLEHRDRER